MRNSSLLVCLLALSLAAAALRMTSLGYELPTRQDPDRIIVTQGIAFDKALPGEDVGPYVSPLYPHLLGRILGALPGALTPAVSNPASLQEHLKAASAPDTTARRLIAFLSSLLVPASFLLARRFLGPKPALLATGLTASSMLLVYYARQARPHGALAFFCVLSLLAFMWLARRGTLTSYIAAGIAAALAIGTLHNGAAVLPALGTALLIRWRTDGLRSWPKLLIPVAFVAASIRFFYPFVFGGTLMSYRKFPVNVFDGGGFGVIGASMVGAEPVLTILLLLGVVLGTLRLRRVWGEGSTELRNDLLVVASFTIPYLTVVGIFYQSWARFLLPVIPIFACLAAAGASWTFAPLTRRIQSSRTHAALAVFLGVALVALPSYAASRLVWLQSKRSVRALTGDWVHANLDPIRDTLVLPPDFSLPLLLKRKSLVQDIGHTSLFHQYQRDNVRGGWRTGNIRWNSKVLDTLALTSEELVHEINKLSDCYLILQKRPKQTNVRNAVVAAGGEVVFGITRSTFFKLNRPLNNYRAEVDYNLFCSSIFKSERGASLEIFHFQ